MNISENWTAEERLKVIDKVAREMSAVIFPNPRDHQNWMERIHFLATASPGFLNSNRAMIIGREE